MLKKKVHIAVKGQQVSGSSLKPLPLYKDEMGEKVQESQVLSTSVEIITDMTS